MKVETYSDWEQVKADLTTQLKSINYNPNLFKILNNIQDMVNDLSRVAVDARRTRNSRIIVDKLTEINGAIEQLEKLIMYAILID
jgi:hypothetical protein